MGKASEPPNQPEPDSYEVLDKETLEHLLNRTLAVAKSKRFRRPARCSGRRRGALRQGLRPVVCEEGHATERDARAMPPRNIPQAYRRRDRRTVRSSRRSKTSSRRSPPRSPTRIGFTRYLGERPVCVRADAAELSPGRPVAPCGRCRAVRGQGADRQAERRLRVQDGDGRRADARKDAVVGPRRRARRQGGETQQNARVQQVRHDHPQHDGQYVHRGDALLLVVPAEDAPSGAPPIDDSERGRAKGYYLYGGTGLHPSPVFASTTPRASDAFKAMKGPNVGGPLKPAHGCALKNPAPAAGRLAGGRRLAGAHLVAALPDKSSSLEQRFVDERMRECEDHSRGAAAALDKVDRLVAR